MSEIDIAKLGIEPIPGDNPVGEDARFEDDFTAIREEIAKLVSPDNEPVAWGDVIEKGTAILSEKSKHLQVAIFLVLAYFERDGYAGLSAGLDLCDNLLTNYWDTMYPPVARKRGRIEPFSWLAERGGITAADRPANSSDLEALKAIGEKFAKIEGFLTEKLGSDAPGFGDLRRDLAAKAKNIEAKLKAAEEKAKRKAAAAAAGTPEIESVDEANKLLTQIRQSVKNVAEYFRKADPTKPFAYQLLRAVNFSAIAVLPPANEGTTQVPAPPPEVVKRLEEDIEKQDHKAVIESVEVLFPNAVFWLDLQRFILQAMEGAGEAFEAAQAAVADEVGQFIRRLPEATELKFANGTPFAQPETIKLLEGLAASSGGEAKSSGGGGAEDEAFVETIRAAKKLGKKKLPKAIALLQEAIGRTGERRGQFLWRLELARLCLEAGKMELAVPQLEYLVDQIDAHHLEEWEPQLCRDVFGTLYIAQQRVAKINRARAPELGKVLQDLHARLCRLDVAAALEIEKAATKAK